MLHVHVYMYTSNGTYMCVHAVLICCHVATFNLHGSVTTMFYLLTFVLAIIGVFIMLITCYVRFFSLSNIEIEFDFDFTEILTIKYMFKHHILSN